jgi:outer membrane protein assembly factor BamB
MNLVLGRLYQVKTNYVVCYDFSGKMLWQFPAHTVDTSAVALGQVKGARLLGEAVMDPLGRAILGQDRNGWGYNLNISTGKVIRKGPGKSLRYGISFRTVTATSTMTAKPVSFATWTVEPVTRRRRSV